MTTSVQSQHVEFIRSCKTVEEVDIQEARLHRITNGQIPEALRVVISSQRVIIDSDQKVKNLK